MIFTTIYNAFSIINMKGMIENILWDEDKADSINNARSK